MKYIIALAVIVLVHSSCFSQEDLILWNDNKPLKWKDFTGEVDKSSIYDALTAGGIRYRYKYSSNGKETTFQFEVFSKFTKNKSWSKKEKQNDDLLKHEQLHFDIAELFARKLKVQLEKQTYGANFSKEIADIAATTNTELAAMQQKYDDETNHHINTQKQKEWESYIHEELQKWKPTTKD